jgi:hypothetical protein
MALLPPGTRRPGLRIATGGLVKIFWRIFQWTALLWVVIVCLNLTVRAVGNTQPPLPVLQPFLDGCEGKPQPCWYGVMPGTTTEQETYELMAFAGTPRLANLLSGEGYSIIFRFPEPSFYCNAIFFVRDVIVYRAEFSLCRDRDIRVGDLAALLDGQQIVVSMPPNELIYDGVSMNIEEWPNLYRHVTYLTLLAPTSDYPRYPWHGYISRWRYCQLVPYFPRCRVLRR